MAHPNPSNAVPPRLTPAAAQPRRRPWLVWALLLGGILLVALVILLMVFGRHLANELKKAEPIPGITIDVDTGNSVEPERTDHAARAYLNRRLRAAGFDRPGLDPLRIEVVFKKIGQVEYKTATGSVFGEKVRMDIVFFDQDAKRLKTVGVEPKLHSNEKFKYHAETELNQRAYARAVSAILRMELPSPTELGLSK